MSAPTNLSRHLWTLFEPVHSVTYFSAESRDRFEAAGLRGFWRGYFAGRSAPLGAVDATPVIAAFFNFAPGMVRRALPEVWSRATPEDVLRARLDGAVSALRRLHTGPIAEAADLLSEAARHADTGGRVLAAANHALPVPEEPLARLWHAATILREHRGDGHVAALVAHGLDGCETNVWRASLDRPRQVLQPARGWTDTEWDDAAARLRERGWLDESDGATAMANDAHAEIERITDQVASRPWDRLGEQATARLITLLSPLARAAYAEIPDYLPIALPRP